MELKCQKCLAHPQPRLLPLVELLLGEETELYNLRLVNSWFLCDVFTLGVDVGGVGVYSHRYRWGNASCNLTCCCRLHFPVVMVWLQTQKDGITGRISIWGKSRECANSRGD